MYNGVVCNLDTQYVGIVLVSLQLGTNYVVLDSLASKVWEMHIAVCGFGEF